MGQTRVPGLYSWGRRCWGRKGAPIVIPSPVRLYVMVMECQTEWRFGIGGTGLPPPSTPALQFKCLFMARISPLPLSV